MIRKLSRLIVASTLMVAPLTLYAESNAPLYPEFPAMKDSKAYKRFITRPLSERSKLLYMIDRFTDSKIKIVYDGVYFDPGVVGPIARWFLSRHYNKEAAEKWVMMWCNTSVPEGNLIWVQLPQGQFRLGRDILLEELKALNESVAGTHAPTVAVSSDASLPSSESVASQIGTTTLAPMVQASGNKT